jgi:hypothetical protein
LQLHSNAFPGHWNGNQGPQREFGPISLEFPDYAGQKVQDMPEAFVRFLTGADKTGVPDGTSESDVGITEFRNPGFAGFDAILKHRFSDFNVNEIDLDGNIVRLTNLEVPKNVIKVPQINHSNQSSLTKRRMTK